MLLQYKRLNGPMGVCLLIAVVKGGELDQDPYKPSVGRAIR